MKEPEYEINVEERVSELWYFMQCAIEDIPRCYPPPVVIKHSTKEELKKYNNDEPTGIICAQIYTTHIKNMFGVIPIQYQLTIFIDNCLYYLTNSWGKRISRIAMKMFVDHILIHELFHYCRNVTEYLKICGEPYYTKTYNTNLDRYYTYWKNAGKEDDEEATEDITIELLKELYDVGSDLNPLWNGRFAYYKEKTTPGYIDRLSMINYFVMDNFIAQAQTETSLISQTEAEVTALSCLQIVKYHVKKQRNDLVVPKLIYSNKEN